jgi:hypothetical protein
VLLVQYRHSDCHGYCDLRSTVRCDLVCDLLHLRSRIDPEDDPAGVMASYWQFATTQPSTLNSTHILLRQSVCVRPYDIFAGWQCIDPRSFLLPQYGRSVTILSFSTPLRVCLAELPNPDRHDIGQSSPRRETPVLQLGRLCYRCASRANTTVHRIPRRR